MIFLKMTQLIKIHVSEASFDLRLSNKYDTFFNLNSGINHLKNEIVSIYCVKDKFKFSKKIKVSIPRLSFKSFYLSKILPQKFEGGVVKIKQPIQKLFYGRMLAGRLNKRTKSFQLITLIMTLLIFMNILNHQKVTELIHI